MSRRSSVLAALFVSSLPLVVAAAEPRFQSFGIADLSGGEAFDVSDDGCTFLARGGPIAAPVHHHFRFGRIAPLLDLAGGEELTIVAGMSGDGQRVVGETDTQDFQRQSFLWEEGIADVQGPFEFPARFLGISGDGETIVGFGSYSLHAFRSGPLAATLMPVAGRSRSTASEASADGAVVAGSSLGLGPEVATRWDAAAGDAPESLGVLPGELATRALGISADGTTVVGRSGARAFRWRDGVLEDLGPGEARAASADGSVVLGDTFLWDVANGRRELAAALEADFGLDLSAWERLVGHDLSPDGLSLVGAAARPGGPLRAFRARRRADARPAEPLPRNLPLVVPDLVAGPFELDAIRPTAGAAGAVYVNGFRETSVLLARARSGPDDPWAPIEEREVGDEVFAFAVGPEGEAFASTVAEKLLRIGTDGVVTELLDGSVYPKPIQFPGTEFEFPVPTRAIELARAPDGTLFVAALARALRIDPDGQVAELFDFDLLVEQGSANGGLFHVERHPDGRVLWGDGLFSILVTDGVGNLLEVIPDAEDFLVTEEGGLWRLTSFSLSYTRPDGVVEVIDLVDADGIEWDEIIGFAGFATDGEGGVLFVAEGFLRQGPPPAGERFESHLLHLSADRELVPLLPARVFAYADGSAFVAEREGVRQVQIRPPATACRNGRDDDGDGLADGDDPGCSGDLDPSERSAALPCDDGDDDDGDGLADFPDDPGCASWTAPTEEPECSDGVDNDGDGRVDWNGAGLGAPDPQCSSASQHAERDACGVGFELALVVFAARALRRRVRSG